MRSRCRTAVRRAGIFGAMTLYAICLCAGGVGLIVADPFAASRLPDLPNAGYASNLQRELSDAMMFLIRGFERDRLLLIETVIRGAQLWRRRFKSAFRVLKADDEMADAVFGYFQLMVGPNPEAQKEILLGLYTQQAIQSWDKRLKTAMQGAKNHRQLMEAIAKENRVKRKAKKFYV